MSEMNFKTFVKKSIADLVKKINMKMKEDGLVYVYGSEDFFNPDDMTIVSYDNGENYADERYTDSINFNILKQILPEYDAEDEETEEIDFSDFTSKKKLQNFIDTGFDRLKKKQRLDYIKDRKESIRNKIRTLENEIHYKQLELENEKNELEDFSAEENNMKKDE